MKTKLMVLTTILMLIVSFVPTITKASSFDLGGDKDLFFSSKETIKDKIGGAVFNFVTADPSGGTWTGSGSPTDYNKYIYEEGNGIIAIFVSKTEGGSGRTVTGYIIQKDPNGGWTTASDLNRAPIKDPNKYYDPSNVVALGRIWGKVYFENFKDIKKSTYDITGERLNLFDNGGVPLATRKMTIDDSSEEGYYDAFTITDSGIHTKIVFGITSSGGKKIYTKEKYKLNYYYSNHYVDCKTGVGGITNPITDQCSFNVSGTTTFIINDDLTINILNTDERVDAETLKGVKLKEGIVTQDNGINIVLRATIENPLVTALANAIKWMADTINKAITYFSTWINAALKKGSEIEDMKQSWFDVRNISITLLMLGLIIIAFANVLNIDIAQYGAQRMIPRFVMNIVLAFFSFLIVKFLLEVANVLQNEFISRLGDGSPNVVNLKASIDLLNLAPSEIVGMIGTIIVLFLVYIGVIIALIYLFLMLIARIVVIKFLVVMGPVALVLGIMPFTESQLKQWWSELFKWIFMGPAIMGLLLIGAIITKNTSNAGVIHLKNGNADFLDAFDGIFYVLTAAAAYFMAASIPMQMGGKVMAAWDKKVRGAGKFAGKQTFGRAWDGTKKVGANSRIARAWTQSKEAKSQIKERKAKKRGSDLRLGVAERGKWLGRRAAGYESKQDLEASKKRVFNAIVDEESTKLGEDRIAWEKAAVSSNSNKAQQIAALRKIGGSAKGLNDADTGIGIEQRKLMRKYALDETADEYDSQLSSLLFKENPGVLTELGSSGAVKVIAGKNINTDLKAGHIKGLISAATSNQGNASSAREALRAYKAADIQQIKNQELRKAFADAANKGLLNYKAANAANVGSQGPTQAPPGSTPEGGGPSV